MRRQLVDILRCHDLCLLQLMRGWGVCLHSGERTKRVHEVVDSSIEHKESYVDAENDPKWTAADICAHESCIQHGAEVVIPNVELCEGQRLQP